MGVDIHEKRRALDEPDKNPAVRRPNNWVPGGTGRIARIIEWRQRRARSMYFYTKLYLGGTR